MSTFEWSVSDLVPHDGPMLLLDEVVAAEGDMLTTRVIPRGDGMFDENGQVGAWVGLEYMAQTMAALAGWEGRQRGEAPRVGLMLGTRRYHCHVPFFRVGEPLLVTAQREFEADNGIGVMQCRIETPDHTLLAEALLSAYQPDNLDAFLKEQA
ncbi:putative hotdog family 3-hydroxylacyl-ACP dehydratase [Silvimonas terrae]|uniref:Putative hotdog family 3-hydroxylacyl-ACP dehydratase n=1 Tax=Silvimonas terrae TaxID=300266 RepID=A0A840RFG4_9NEIS|nr:3-hydroxylacyl-ACP dehydratase [Silvimonas terrae]MBB5191258.1 putative hotdog family 3-hydroxylacyl-ACP dehydratase [Silvimonas terrae]